MGDTLEALHRLQVIETRLAEIRRKTEEKSRRVAAQKRLARQTEEKLELNHKSRLERQARLDALNLDVTAREEAIAKQRDTLNKAKTNKAYAEILAAMNTSKADNSKLESSILQLMEELQTLDQAQESIESEREELQTKVTGAEAQLREHEASCREEREKLEAQRDECAAAVAPTILSTFTRAANHHDGEAMAPAFKLHAKREDYACGGCNMKVTLEVVAGLQIGSELQVCSHCGRVLFLEPNPVA